MQARAFSLFCRCAGRDVAESGHADMLQESTWSACQIWGECDIQPVGMCGLNALAMGGSVVVDVVNWEERRRAEEEDPHSDMAAHCGLAHIWGYPTSPG